MLGRRSLLLPLNSCDPDIDHTFKQLRSKKNSNLLEKWPTKTMDENNPMALRDHYLPTMYTSPTCLRLPVVTAAHYEIKPSTIQSLPYFLGLSTSNPYGFLGEFLVVCSTIKLSGSTEDALRMLSLLPQGKSQTLVSFLSTKLHYFFGSIATRISEEVFSHRNDQ